MNIATDTHESFAQRRIIAALIGFGVSKARVARMLGLRYQDVAGLCKEPDFQSMVEAAALTHEHNVVEALLAGELKAAARLMTLVDSEDDDIALKASLALLDRMGKRGKPVEKTEMKQLVLTADPQEMLNRAMRDPGVRARLKEVMQPALLPLPSEIDEEPQWTPAQPASTSTTKSAPPADTVQPADNGDGDSG